MLPFIPKLLFGDEGINPVWYFSLHRMYGGYHSRSNKPANDKD